MITYDIEGLDRVGGRLSKLENVKRLLKPPMERGALDAQRIMSTYPPARPRSRYRRTGTYGRRWTMESRDTTDGFQVTVGNNTSYGPLVGGAQTQARVHRGRWPTDQATMERVGPRVQREIQDAVNSIMSS